MTQSRTKALLKLSLLLGIPLLIMFLLFCSGVYLGVRYQVPILRFERDWLKLDVVVPDVPIPTTDDVKDVKSDPPTPISTVNEETSPPVVIAASKEEKPEEPIEKEEKQTPAVEHTTAPKHELRAAKPVPLTLTLPEPLPSELNAVRVRPLNLKVQALVDPTIVATNPDWITEIQQTLTWASQIFESQFGISLEIYGIMQWSGINDEMTREDLLAKIQPKIAEEADLVLAFHAREREYQQQADGVNGTAKAASSAVVFAQSDSQAPYLRSLLYELSALLGASPITQNDSEEFQAGSWMTVAQFSDRQPLWMDASNRRHILEHKKALLTRSAERGQHD